MRLKFNEVFVGQEQCDGVNLLKFVFDHSTYLLAISTSRNPQKNNYKNLNTAYYH